MYALLFGIGRLILGPRLFGAGLIAAALVAGAVIVRLFEPEIDEPVDGDTPV